MHLSYGSICHEVWGILVHACMTKYRKKPNTCFKSIFTPVLNNHKPYKSSTEETLTKNVIKAKDGKSTHSAERELIGGRGVYYSFICVLDDEYLENCKRLDFRQNLHT